jgi:hypothetical protein
MGGDIDQSFEAKACFYNKEFSPYLRENITLHNYQDQFVDLFKEIIAVYTENHTRSLNTKCTVTEC